MGRHPFGIALFIALLDVFFPFLIPNGVGGIRAKLPRQNQIRQNEIMARTKSHIPLPKSARRGGYAWGVFAADKVKRADGTAASADAMKKNAPQRKVGPRRRV